MIERLELKHFTAFTNISIDFSPKINIIIGENGTGKTHLLKSAYGLCCAASQLQGTTGGESSGIASVLTKQFVDLFCPIDRKLGKMRRNGAPANAEVMARLLPGKRISASFHTNSKIFSKVEYIGDGEYSWKPVFIPTKEVLSLARCLGEGSYDSETIHCLYDAGYLDLAKALLAPVSGNPDQKVDKDPRLGSIIPRLVNLIGGRYEWEDGVSVFHVGKYEEKASQKRSSSRTAQVYQDSTVTTFTPKPLEQYSSDMTAEGFRKFGILHQLLLNDSIQPGVSGPLFWDEPESNLNPKLMKLLVQVLLELSRNGQQIVLGTHDYVLLKWMDLLSDEGKGDHVRYHCLHRDKGSNEVVIETADDYGMISKSSISSAFAELYDEDVKRALEGD